MPSKHLNTITVAEYVAKAMELSGKSQKEIARDAGFRKPNVLSMIKTGETKIALERIPAFAKACGVDAAPLMRLAMREYHPAAWAALSETLGDPLTLEERKLVDAYREIAPRSEIEINMTRKVKIQNALREV
jgi:transcriptional regulator with XRE-family HTH domain